VTVAGNWTTEHGGWLAKETFSPPPLVNTIVWENAPEQLYFDLDWPGQAVTFAYSDIQGAAAGIATNGYRPIYWGSGNIDKAPRFVNAGMGIYHLQRVVASVLSS